MECYRPSTQLTKFRPFTSPSSTHGTRRQVLLAAANILCGCGWRPFPNWMHLRGVFCLMDPDRICILHAHSVAGNISAFRRPSVQLLVSFSVLASVLHSFIHQPAGAAAKPMRKLRLHGGAATRRRRKFHDYSNDFRLFVSPPYQRTSHTPLLLPPMRRKEQTK